MTDFVVPHCPDGLLSPAVLARTQVSQRNTKNGDSLYTFTLPCAPEAKTAIHATFISHLAGSLTMDFGRTAPARAFVCPDGARDIADTVSLIRIDMSRGDTHITPQVLFETLKPLVDGLHWVADIARVGSSTHIAQSAGAALSRDALKDYHGTSNLVALVSGCQDFLGTAQTAGIELVASSPLLQGLMAHTTRIIVHLPPAKASPGSGRRPPAWLTPGGPPHLHPPSNTVAASTHTLTTPQAAAAIAAAIPVASAMANPSSVGPLPQPAAVPKAPPPPPEDAAPMDEDSLAPNLMSPGKSAPGGATPSFMVPKKPSPAGILRLIPRKQPTKLSTPLDLDALKRKALRAATLTLRKADSERARLASNAMYVANQEMAIAAAQAAALATAASIARAQSLAQADHDRAFGLVLFIPSASSDTWLVVPTPPPLSAHLRVGKEPAHPIYVPDAPPPSELLAPSSDLVHSPPSSDVEQLPDLFDISEQLSAPSTTPSHVEPLTVPSHDVEQIAFRYKRTRDALVDSSGHPDSDVDSDEYEDAESPPDAADEVDPMDLSDFAPTPASAAVLRAQAQPSPHA